MAKELFAYTKVKVKDNEYFCETFPEVWEVLASNGYSINEENKTNLIRLLFISGYWEVDDKLSLEVIWRN